MPMHFNGIPVDEKSSQDKILTALLNLLKRKHFESISITELCNESGLSRNTFYKFFANKNALIDYLYDDLILGYHGLKKELLDHDSLGMESGFLHFFRYWHLMRDWVKALVDNDLWKPERIMTDTAVSLLTPRNWGSYLTDNEETKTFIFQFINAGCMEMVLRWCQNDFRQTPEEMAHMVTYILSGQMTKIK